jgi:hypothetical protein
MAGPVIDSSFSAAGGGFDLGAVYRLRIGGRRRGPPRYPFPTMYLPGAAIAARSAQYDSAVANNFFICGEDVSCAPVC